MTRVDELISKGAVQVSRKYRKVFVGPPSSVDFLRENHPDIYDRLVDDALTRFESEARGAVWGRFNKEHTTELTEEEFAEFREKTTGKAPWTPEGKEPCAHCQSLGHMHRRGCPNG